MLALAREPYIKGLTTNPTLMRKAGVTDYVGFAKEVLASIKEKPISFEVFSDDFSEMEAQARTIASWGENVYVKIPITNTRGESAFDVIKKLTGEGIKVNVTALLTLGQVEHIRGAFAPGVPGIVSVFAGRIADTGADAVPLMRAAKEALASHPHLELLWASPRELFNIYQAEYAGADIITVSPDILKKLSKIGYDHEKLSLETVQMFFDDGKKAGYSLRDTPTYVSGYLAEVKQIAEQIDQKAIETVAELLAQIRAQGGRLFIVGVGGSAANASHAVNDFRKIAHLEAYTPTDNPAELTARINDDGWDSAFAKWLERSNLGNKDAVMVLSVGGGNAEKKVSVNIIEALTHAKKVGAKVLGIVSRDGGHTAQVADACVIVPVINAETVTPHAESWQAVVWHCLVFHPAMRKIEGKWESLSPKK
jgi:transaldolase